MRVMGFASLYPSGYDFHPYLLIAAAVSLRIKSRCSKQNIAMGKHTSLAGGIDIGQTGDAKYMMNETARHRGNGFVGCANARTAH
jgi:hypothetical protein